MKLLFIISSNILIVHQLLVVDFAKELHLFDLKAGFYDIPN